MASVHAHSDDDRIDQSPESASDSVQSQLTLHSVPYSGLPMHMYPFAQGVVNTSQPQIRSKRRQVKNACTNCQKACKKCDDARPCLRCVKYGIGEECIDSQRKERKKGIKRGPYKKRDGKSELFLTVSLLIDSYILPSQLVAQPPQLTLNLTLHPLHPSACHSRVYPQLGAPHRPLRLWARSVTQFRSTDSTLLCQVCPSPVRPRPTILPITFRCSHPRRLTLVKSMRVLVILSRPISIIPTFLMVLCRTLLPISCRTIARRCRFSCSLMLNTLGILRMVTTRLTPSRRLPVTRVWMFQST
jgi:hypothetical protein